MVSKKDVQYISHLSRIYTDDQEAEALAKNLEDILTYIEKLKKLDITNVKPTSHVLPLKNVFRDDILRKSLGQQAAIKIAVESENGSFKVPQVIE
ncbi:MAG: Asp-tRNA(Asn)/Glu-tRNA(Gln) amidotransferase subunit GatC [Candidatus Omnitrophica bacterium]|nr:Asp-tRNA(Asn)/Glu-tRNA(Gln) amidotransferase subunit GatC [Candidatus Omnitrophota bacterium]